MSLPRTTGGQVVGTGQGEALWFNGGLAVVRVTGDQTEGRYAVLELLAPKGFASPIHVFGLSPLRRGVRPRRSRSCGTRSRWSDWLDCDDRRLRDHAVALIIGRWRLRGIVLIERAFHPFRSFAEGSKGCRAAA